MIPFLKPPLLVASFVVAEKIPEKTETHPERNSDLLQQVQRRRKAVDTYCRCWRGGNVKRQFDHHPGGPFASFDERRRSQCRQVVLNVSEASAVAGASGLARVSSLHIICAAHHTLSLAAVLVRGFLPDFIVQPDVACCGYNTGTTSHCFC